MENKDPRYNPKPFDERPSQKLGVFDYVKKRVGLVLLPFITAAAGWAIGKTRKLPDDFYQKDTSDMSFGQKYIYASQRGAQHYFGNTDHRGPGLAFIGLKVGAVVTAFLLWRQDEKKRLEVADTVSEVKDIAHLHQTNEDLQKDNVLVEKMIAHEQDKQEALLQNTPADFRTRESQRQQQPSQLVNTP